MALTPRAHVLFKVSFQQPACWPSLPWRGLMCESTGSSTQGRAAQLFQQEENLLYEDLFSEKVPWRTLCLVFEAGGVSELCSHCIHEPQAIFIFAPGLFRFICSDESSVPFCGLYVVREWICDVISLQWQASCLLWARKSSRVSCLL